MDAIMKITDEKMYTLFGNAPWHHAKFHAVSETGFYLEKKIV